MHLRIVALGKCKLEFIQGGVAEYLKRLKPHVKCEVIELNADRFSALPEAEAKKREAELLRDALQPSDRLFVLDEHGKRFSSRQFAELLSKEMQSSARRLVLAIGGVNGWDPSILSQAAHSISLSELTFTAQLARLVLVEQIYRAVTLIKGLPYHR